ncbi:MAG: helicase-related protein [Promethearchaeota archaeon]
MANYREILVSRVASQLYGPRFGLEEVLHEDLNPYHLYLSGVLIPEPKNENTISSGESKEPSLEMDDDFEFDMEPSNNISSDISSIINDDQQEDIEVGCPSEFLKVLDLRSRPHSFGISFLVETLTSSPPEIDVCFTWARYRYHNNIIQNAADENGDLKSKFNWFPSKILDKKEKNESIGGWKREPRYLIFNNLCLDPISGFHIFNGDSKEFHSSSHSGKKDYKLFFNYEQDSFEIAFRVTRAPTFFSVDINLEKDSLNQDAGENSSKGAKYRISIFFKNTLDLESSLSNEEEIIKEKKSEKKVLYGVYKYIFQPQIRVKCCKNTRIIPYSQKGQEEKLNRLLSVESCDPMLQEMYNLEMLYRNKRPKGKGHLCAVTWRGVDPQDLSTLIKEADDVRALEGGNIPGYWKHIDGKRYRRVPAIKAPPFYWVDGDIISDIDQKKKFESVDIRSVFVPISVVNSPKFDWRFFDKDEIDDLKLLDPSYISEYGWDKDKLKEILMPLVRNYKTWVNQRKTELINELKNKKLSSGFYEIAELNLRQHKRAIKRIYQGIQILMADFNARISFCFANKALLLQHEWSVKNNEKRDVQGFKWRPFQIAFLLLSLRGIVDNRASNPDRNLVDLIWIPTGGGKTEAYLLIAAFLIAYRRRLAMSGLKHPIIRDLNDDNVDIKIEKANNRKDHEQKLVNGVILLSRYTLRLLTIQQFRRATRMITACEYLRVFFDSSEGKLDNILLTNGKESEKIGWLPSSLKRCKNDSTAIDDAITRFFKEESPWIWGPTQIAIGLLVGNELSPNRLNTIYPDKKPIFGAFDILRKESRRKDSSRSRINTFRYVGEPAQIMNCPACGNILNLPKTANYSFSEDLRLFLLIKTPNGMSIEDFKNRFEKFKKECSKPYINLKKIPIYLQDVQIFFKENHIIATVHLKLRNYMDSVNPDVLKAYWDRFEEENGVKLASASILSPGYFIVKKTDGGRNSDLDFEIRCLNPKCPLFNIYWTEIRAFFDGTNTIIGKTRVSIPFELRKERNERSNIVVSKGIPIPALTVDEQVFSRLPAMVIGTVDKFAQLAFKPEMGSIFGNVDKFHPINGFSRFTDHIPRKVKRNYYFKEPLNPPELILQDELHLITGPLGSTVGIYEMLIEELCKRDVLEADNVIIPKYIASTATIRAGEKQVKALFTRDFYIFPAFGIRENDSYFIYYDDKNQHPLLERDPGRIYMGLATPGKSFQTTLTRIFGSIFQTTYNMGKKALTDLNYKELDRFWTVVGYFNKLKDLAAMRSVYYQDLIEWIKFFYGESDIRQIGTAENDLVELCSWTDSTILPSYLELLKKGITRDPASINSTINTVLTTSMFGTGVDIHRLGLMVMNGQPKTVSSYIQATGRIGRQMGGIIFVFFMVGRPRDLNHYEDFTSFHQALYKYVEPVTVTPFASNNLKNTLGPVFIALVRQSRQIGEQNVEVSWRSDDEGPIQIVNFLDDPQSSKLVNEFFKIVKKRHQAQPYSRYFNISKDLNDFIERLAEWVHLVKEKKIEDLRYNEYTLAHPATCSVVLGDPAHAIAQKEKNDLFVVFDNAPNSMRDIEDSITFDTRLDR